MKWASAVKMWNMHGKIYNPRHVYAIPRKGTAEYLDVKHIQEHGELPTHLKKKGPFPPEAMEQLRKHAAESTARREAAERKRLTEEIEKVRSPKLRIVEAEEEAPPIKVPALPERLEKKEKKTTPAKAQKKEADRISKENAEKRRKYEAEQKAIRENYDAAKYKKIWGNDDFNIKDFLASKGIEYISDFQNALAAKSIPASIIPDRPEYVWGEHFWRDYADDLEIGTYKLGQTMPEHVKKILTSQKKLTPAKAKVIAAILEEAKKRKAAATAKPDLSKFDAIKELGEDGKEPKKGESKEKLKAQTQTVSIMKKRVLELLKEANKIEDFSKKIKASSHMEQELYKVEELLDLIKEAGGGKAIFEKKK